MAAVAAVEKRGVLSQAVNRMFGLSDRLTCSNVSLLTPPMSARRDRGAWGKGF